MRTVDKSEERRSSAKRKQLFHAAFLRHCHELVAMGYAKLDAASFRTKEETVITGELVKAMNAAIESSDAPRWVARYFVLDDPPVNAPGRTGKRRRRVDIEVTRARPGPRPRFQFEAKRLHAGRSITAYLGPDGMGLFLTSDYADGHEDAGMLGYVQSGEPSDWAEKIGTRISAEPTNYGVRDDGRFQRHDLAPALNCTYCSKHDRRGKGMPITVFHIFLLFTERPT